LGYAKHPSYGVFGINHLAADFFGMIEREGNVVTLTTNYVTGGTAFAVVRSGVIVLQDGSNHGDTPTRWLIESPTLSTDGKITHQNRPHASPSDMVTPTQGRSKC